MHDVMRKRILRKLERLPEAQLYHILDYLDFLEARYASAEAPRVNTFQRFAERLEDGIRARSLAGAAVTGTMKVVSTAGKVLDGLSGALAAAARGGEPWQEPDRQAPAHPAGAERPGQTVAADVGAGPAPESRGVALTGPIATAPRAHADAADGLAEDAAEAEDGRRGGAATGA